MHEEQIGKAFCCLGRRLHKEVSVWHSKLSTATASAIGCETPAFRRLKNDKVHADSCKCQNIRRTFDAFRGYEVELHLT